MSMLLGPLSETISKVSCRDCALAGEKIAGADTMLAPATAAVDFRKSRRFMKLSRCPPAIRGKTHQESCQNVMAVVAPGYSIDLLRIPARDNNLAEPLLGQGAHVHCIQL